MKYLEIGDGITWGKEYPKKSEEIHQLLENNGYKTYVKTSKRIFSEDDSFKWDGRHWLTCYDHSVQNPLSYEQIKAKILGVTEPQYEIY